ncbi:MAG TPA: serine hydrolase, partial [Thermoanaerobaculia bacterium]|nr:serine hydrolase [Thermoanaerobaculia bacterium]
GVADRDSGRAVTADTPFYIASTTKAFTALAAARMAERGEIDLDAPLSRYLPDLKLRPPLSADAITVRDLLTMTHGIDSGGPAVFRTAFSGEFTRDGLIALLASYPPARTGRAFHYGNLGYNILGLVLEARTKTSWKDVVRREVLDPAGMRGTRARVSELDRDEIALPHVAAPDGWRRIPLGKTDANMHAAGGLFSSARDLGRFVAAELGGGRIEGAPVFPADVIARTQKAAVEQDKDDPPFHRFAWGFGWDLTRYEGDLVVSRFGGFGGYYSHLSFMPEHGIGVVALVNGEPISAAGADLVATYAYDRLLGKADLEKTYAARLGALEAKRDKYRMHLVEDGAKRAARQKPLPHPLADYAGVYENPRWGRMEWRVVADGLEVRAGAATCRAEVFDAAKDQLRVELRGDGEIVEFRFPKSGGAADALRYVDEDWTRVTR